MIYLVIVIFAVTGAAGLITNHDIAGAVFSVGSMVLLVLQRILDKMEEK